MDILDFLQWPGFLTGLLGAWLVCSHKPRVRRNGFVLFLVSNILWITWAGYAQAFALILMQICFMVTSIRGIMLCAVRQEEGAENKVAHRQGEL